MHEDRFKEFLHKGGNKSGKFYEVKIWSGGEAGIAAGRFAWQSSDGIVLIGPNDEQIFIDAEEFIEARELAPLEQLGWSLEDDGVVIRDEKS